MGLLALLGNHTHYWGVPHTRLSDDKLVMTCYECGTEQQLRIELRPELAKVDRSELLVAGSRTTPQLATNS